VTPLIDIGVNLTNSQLLPHIDDILLKSAEASVGHIVITGTSVTESEAALKLAQQHPKQLSSTAGVHPHDAKEWNSDTVEVLSHLIQHNEVKAVGETGLDFNRNYSPKKEQINAFEQQIELAIEYQKPLFLHQRDAHDELFSILKNRRNKRPKIVIHCFTDNKKSLFDYLDEDFYIGVTGWVCDPKRGLELQKLIPSIPLERLMIETDAPYLLPKNLTISPKPKFNQPAFLPHIAQTIADLYQQPLETIAHATHQNSIGFFNLDHL